MKNSQKHEICYRSWNFSNVCVQQYQLTDILEMSYF